MKILVTGGAGFIGSWLVESLIGAKHEVTVVDSLSPQIHGNLPRPEVRWLKQDLGVKFVRADIRDQAAIDEALSQVEAVVHLAAETGTGQSMYQIGHYYEVNQQATAAMLEAIVARHKQVRKVVLASSRSIYGEGAYMDGDELVVPAPRDPIRLQAGQFEPVGNQGQALHLVATPEHAPPRPASIYAATKLANETMGRIVANSYGVEITALRFQNVYGERQSLRNPYTGILSIFSNRMRQGLPINIFEDGRESRDFVHVSDVVRAISLSLERPLPGFEAINIGSGHPTTVDEVARLLRHLLASESPLQVTGDFRIGDIRHCYADITRAHTLLDFEPMVDIATGIERFVRWVEGQEIVEDLSAQAQRQLTQLGLGRTK